MELHPLEREVLSALLTGQHPVLTGLRQQADDLRVVERRLTGVGFFTDFEIDAGCPSVELAKDRLVFGDVHATIEGLQQEAGFLLWVENGYLATLEAFCYDEVWPDEFTTFELKFEAPDRTAVLARSLKRGRYLLFYFWDKSKKVNTVPYR